MFAVNVGALGLAIRPVRAADIGPLVPVETQPVNVFQKLPLEFGLGSFDVGILDAENEAALLSAGEEPVEKSRAGVADVQVACRAGAKRTRIGGLDSVIAFYYITSASIFINCLNLEADSCRYSEEEIFWGLWREVSN